ncbi:MAG: 3-dehydroquinate synthase [Clostridia bacterium]|nr:3-dehydroquinate synthase [Clostridia bacterium]
MEVKVNASKNYSVVIKDDITLFSNYIKDLKGDKVAIISDSNVDALYGGLLDKALLNKKVYEYTFKAGENSKNANTYIEILNFLAKNQFKRNDTIIALGGGVTGDLAGFVAGTYMRGINLIMVPTTLLSMVDSSVGGKTAINLDSGKNLAGVFYQPSLVYIALDFLKTLPKREILSGMGEVIKYAFLGDLVTVDDIKQGITKELIYKCVSIKADIVNKDEKESGERKLLNLGHTVGHAIEKASNYFISHGECVLLGMKKAIEISKSVNGLTEDNANKAMEILLLSGSKLSLSFDKDELYSYLKQDKKGQGDKVDFIVINNDLKGEIKSIELKELYNLL